MTCEILSLDWLRLIVEIRDAIISVNRLNVSLRNYFNLQYFKQN